MKYDERCSEFCHQHRSTKDGSNIATNIVLLMLEIDVYCNCLSLCHKLFRPLRLDDLILGQESYYVSSIRKNFICLYGLPTTFEYAHTQFRNINWKIQTNNGNIWFNFMGVGWVGFKLEGRTINWCSHQRQSHVKRFFALANENQEK